MVCFSPPPGLAERLRPLLEHVQKIVVVDNGPVEHHGNLAAQLQQLPRTHLVSNAANLGIAKALNQGIRELITAGCRWALLLDHDSRPHPDMVPQLLSAAQQRARPRAAIHVPRIRYPLPDIECRWPVTQPQHRLRFRRIPASAMTGPRPVDLAISSGMLVDLSLVPQLGLFRDGMFIDLVDTEYCLRTRARGFEIVAVPSAILEHSIGNVQRESLLGLKVYPTHHAPRRHYFLARNRVHLWKAYGRAFPSWACYEFFSAAKLLTKSLLYEPDRWSKLRITLRGTWHGLRTPPPPVTEL